MSIERVANLVQTAKLSDHDRQWFPRWLAKYAAWAHASVATNLVLERDSLIGFLRSIKPQGKPDGCVFADDFLQILSALPSVGTLPKKAKQLHRSVF